MRITANTIDKVFKSKQLSTEQMESQGYNLIEELFVDNSGFGQAGETALTVDAFKTKILNLVKTHKTIYTAITSVGQFQIYIGVFLKGGKHGQVNAKLQVSTA